MSAVKMVAVFAENKPGHLARVTKVLADAQVNIHWVGIVGVEIFGVIRLLVDQPELAHERLRASGLTTSLVEVVAVEAEDRPGSLHAMAGALAEQGLSLHNCSGFVFNDRAILLLEPSDLDQARKVLAGRGLHLLTAEEMLDL
jgi:hypothetical protein